MNSIFSKLKKIIFGDNIDYRQPKATQNLYLNVPYKEKDEAKHLGAKWDNNKKKWYISSSNSDITQFSRWLPSESYNFISDFFYLAQTERKCYKCNTLITVNAIVLPEGCKRIEKDSDDNDKQDIQREFVTQDYHSILAYIKNISPEALIEINKYANNYTLNYSATVNTTYYMSICTNCNAHQGDNFTTIDFNAPFSPRYMDDLKKIIFHKISVPIKLDVYNWSVRYPPLEYFLGTSPQLIDDMIAMYMRVSRAL